MKKIFLFFLLLSTTGAFAQYGPYNLNYNVAIAGTLTVGGQNIPYTLAPIAIQTGAYTAGNNQYIPTNTTSGNITVTLPSTPPDGTQEVIKMITQGGANITTIAAGGSNTFNNVGGSTSITLIYLRQSVLIQYQASLGVWIVIATDPTIAGLDTRYGTLAQQNTNVTNIANNATAITNEATRATTAEGTKQAILVSGTNIKNINGLSPLGSGNLAITTVNTDTTNTGFATNAKLSTYQTKAQNIASYGTLSQQTSNYTAIGLKQAKIIPANPSAPSSTITAGDSTNMALYKLQAQVSTNVTAIAGKVSASNFVFSEIPTGSVNSSNTTFTIANTPTSGTVRLFQNGLRLKVISDYNISGATITFVTAPTTGDTLLADYNK